MMEQPPRKSKWVSVYDRYGDASGELTGNREGLLALRALIDAALANSEARKPEDVDFDFLGVKVTEMPPEDIPDPHETRNKFMGIGCVALLILVLVSASIGAWATIKWLQH